MVHSLFVTKLYEAEIGDERVLADDARFMSEVALRLQQAE